MHTVTESVYIVASSSLVHHDSIASTSVETKTNEERIVNLYKLHPEKQNTILLLSLCNSGVLFYFLFKLSGKQLIESLTIDDVS